MNYKQRTTNGVGVIFYSITTHRHLFLLRNDPKVTVWGLPGGKVERNESLREALERECAEEIGYWPEHAKLFPIEKFTSVDNKFSYHTFYCFVESEFTPTLNHEHVGYCWCNRDVYPQPLHSGLFNTLNYDLIKQKIAIIQESIK
jgi:ADP-ribose pyrophosphatase YjhB (NUDIX family)